MQTISPEFAGALQKGYTTSTLVEVWSPGGYVLADSSTFNVVSGTITVDGSANNQRWVSDLLLADPTGDLIPDQVSGLFSVVSGNELRIYTGMVVNGKPERLLQGVFGLEGALVEDAPGTLTVKVSAFDRARAISRNRLLVPYLIPPSDPPTGTTAITALSALINFSRPGTQIVLAAPDPQFGVPQMILNEEADPWQAARSIAESVGWECFFDYTGTVILRPVLNPNAPGLVSVWEYREGVDSTLLGLRRGFTNDQVFNGEVVTGANTSNSYPPRAVAWDDDPTSPTFYLGPYGKVPEFWQSDAVRDDAQALAAAKARIHQRQGATEALEFSIVPNPAHEVGDVVTIVRARSKVNSQYLLDKFSIGLGASSGAMNITTRQRRP